MPSTLKPEEAPRSFNLGATTALKIASGGSCWHSDRTDISILKVEARNFKERLWRCASLMEFPKMHFPNFLRCILRALDWLNKMQQLQDAVLKDVALLSYPVNHEVT